MASRKDEQVESPRLFPSNSQKNSELEGNLVKTGTKPGQHFSLHNSLYDSLQELCKEKKMYFFKPVAYIDYKPPTLCKGKVWFISFYVKDPSTGKLRRVRIKLNHIPAAERKKAAKELMATYAERLSLGWNPLVQRETPRATHKAFDAYAHFLRVKEKESELETYSCYRSYVKVFQEWLLEEGFDEASLIGTVSHEVALAFMDHLDDDPKYSARTYNNYLSFLGTLHSWLIEKGYISTNPFDGIKRKPRKLMQKKRRVLNNEELAALVKHLQKENQEYLAACMICYSCFVRPKEIALLRCKDIDLEAQTIFVRKEIAKNDNDSFRTIPDAVVPILSKLDLSRPDWFVFGKHNGDACDFSPGREPISHKKFSDYWFHRLRPALGFPEAVQFYSLKDTGITNMATAGVAINLVQQQADHSNVAITSIYLGRKPEADAKIKQAAILPK